MNKRLACIPLVVFHPVTQRTGTPTMTPLYPKVFGHNEPWHAPPAIPWPANRARTCHWLAIDWLL